MIAHTVNMWTSVYVENRVKGDGIRLLACFVFRGCCFCTQRGQQCDGVSSLVVCALGWYLLRPR